MTAELTRCVQRERRSAQASQQSHPSDLLSTPVRALDAETVCVFMLFARLLTWFYRCQWIYIIVAGLCLCVFWAPLIENDYLQRCEEHRRSLEHLHGPINFTNPCAMGCDRQADGFVGESFFSLIILLVYTATPAIIFYNVMLQMMCPILEHRYRHSIFWCHQMMFTCTVLLSMFNQFVSAFAARPLPMFFDLRS